jgi:hypothetical protein
MGKAVESAPDLLEALENLLRQLENVSDYCQTCEEYWRFESPLFGENNGDLMHQEGCATLAAYAARDKAKAKGEVSNG